MDKILFDIHCHAMNMSHPNFIGFLKRAWDSILFKTRKKRLVVFINYLTLFALLTFFIFKFPSFFVWFPVAGFGIVLILLALFLFCYGAFKKVFRLLSKLPFLDPVVDGILDVFNLLCLMENDLGTFFVRMEECAIKHTGNGQTVVLGNSEYRSMIITPLVIDFGGKLKEFEALHFNRKPVKKPVTEQIRDLFMGIRTYLERSEHRFLKIYPFLGINPRNYSLDDISAMLDRYFKDYAGTPEDLAQSMDRLADPARSVDDLHYYAGIKLYPPVGFDPWPDDTDERAKAELIYELCVAKQIPITVHCSDEGFNLRTYNKMKNLTRPEKWEAVLAQDKYQQLKLNLAHMGKLTGSTKWEEQVIALVLKYPNVYTDFSYRGLDDGWYKYMRTLLDSYGPELKLKLLFGSDFMMALLKIDSYCRYLNIFKDTSWLTDSEKEQFCSINPARFLFR